MALLSKERSNFIGPPVHSTKTVTVDRLKSIERSNFIGSQGYSTKTLTVDRPTWGWLVTHVNREVKFIGSEGHSTKAWFSYIGNNRRLEDKESSNVLHSSSLLQK